MCNSCIPPICKVGRIANAKTIIPIPPNHCKKARQIKIPSDKLSNWTMTVEPVVVMPLIDSKKASVKSKLDEEKINGKDENKAIIVQDNTVKMKACLKLILFFWPLIFDLPLLYLLLLFLLIFFFVAQLEQLIYHFLRKFLLF